MSSIVVFLASILVTFSPLDLHCHGFVPSSSTHPPLSLEKTTTTHMAADHDSQASNTTSSPTRQTQPLLTGPIHHTAIKTRNITLAIQFYSLLGFSPAAKFRAGPARAAWLTSDATSSSAAAARLELIEIPDFMLNEPEGKTARAVDLMQRQELLGYNHVAIDVTASIEQLENSSTLSDWMQQLNLKSLQLFNKTLRVAVEPQQIMIGSQVYELAFIYDADGALLELLRKQQDLPQAVGDGWEPWDGEGFVGI